MINKMNQFHWSKLKKKYILNKNCVIGKKMQVTFFTWKLTRISLVQNLDIEYMKNNYNIFSFPAE